MKKSLFFAMAITTSMAFGQQTVDFEELTFPDSQNYWNGSDESGMFQSSSLTFSNIYYPDWSSWFGFAYSKETDNTTEGWANQYSAFAGSGAVDSENYAVWNQNGTITFEQTSIVESIMVTNTTYAAISMRDGDAFGKQFGSTTDANGDDDGTNGEDWFRLIIFGWDNEAEMTDSIVFYLADYRFTDDLDDYIIDTWESINLTSLGEVNQLTFRLESSDVGDWGMNTPNYFALDNIVYEEVESTATITEENKIQFSVYPNPASTDFTLTFEGQENVDAKLVNLSGQLVKEIKGLSSNTKVDASDLQSGVYLLQVQTENHSSTNRIVIH